MMDKLYVFLVWGWLTFLLFMGQFDWMSTDKVILSLAYIAAWFAFESARAHR